MKKFCKIKGLEVEVSRLPVEKKLPSTGEKVVTGYQLFCNEKPTCRENCLLLNKDSGVSPFDE